MDLKLQGLPFSARIFLSLQTLLVILCLFFVFFEAFYLSPQKQLIQLNRSSHNLATQLQLISPLTQTKISHLLTATSAYGESGSAINHVKINWQGEQWQFNQIQTANAKKQSPSSITSSQTIYSLDGIKPLGKLTVSAKKQYRFNYFLAYSIALITIVISICSSLSFYLIIKKENEKLNRGIKKTASNEQQEQALANNESEKAELFLAKKSALEASRVKSTIIANTSHELLTPLNSIVGFSKILLDKKINTEQQDNFLQRINDNALHLSALVNDLLDFSIRSNRMLSLNYLETDIHALLMSITNTMAYEAQSKNLSFIADFDALYGYKIHTDPLRLRQLISNLAINAIRYTNSGHVKITAHFETETANLKSESHRQNNKKILLLSIEDTGIGIAHDQQKNIFSSFVNSSNIGSTSSINKADRNPGLGLGLGLSIVATILQRMGATIDIKSELGSGSRFEIKVPIKQYEANGIDGKPAAFEHILLSGDYPPALDTLEERFQKVSRKVTRNGDTNRELQPQTPSNNDFDFIVFNAAKNTIDELNNDDTKSINTLINLNKPLYITAPIGLTIHNKAMLNNNNIRIINGPFAIQSLLTSKAQKTNNAPLALNNYTVEGIRSPRRKTLVVDDNLSNIELLSLMLSQFQCDVDSASNGEDALSLLDKHDYDWLFIDIRMQPMDGIALVKAIRQLKRYQSTPIIACTAHTSDEEFRILIESGFDKVTYKPIMEQQITALKDVIFESKLTNNDAAITLEAPIFDIQHAIDKTAGNPTTALRIFNLLVAELKQAMTDKKTLMSEHQDIVIDYIHRLHGAAAMTGTTALKNQLNECETLLKNSASIEHISNPLDATENTEKAINDALEAVYDQIELVLEWQSNNKKNNRMDSVFKTLSV